MSFIRELFSTLVDIIEVKQSFEVNRMTYCFIMLLFFMQSLGYIFYSSVTKVIQEEKIRSIQLILGNSTIFYPLSEFGRDQEIEVSFYSVQAYFLLLILYIVGLTLMRMFQPDRYPQIFTKLMPLNKFLNVFLVFYYWVLLVPSLEINSGVLFCGSFSYLAYYQNNCTDYPQRFVIVSLFGIVMLNFFGLSITVLYRNYEFNDRELMKRKFSVVSIVQYLSLTLMISMFWAQQGMNWAIATNLIICFTLVYQFSFQFPFRDRFIMKFFSILGSIYTSGTILTTLWAKIESFSDTEFFYSFFIATTIFSGASISIANKKYEEALCLNSKNFNQFYKYLDVYLEEVFKLAEEQNKNDQAKCTLLKVLIMHQENCLNDMCECKRSSFTDEKGTIELEVVYSLIESIFSWGLNQKVIQNDRSEFENISLKYISFLTKYRNNPAKALYELKVLSTKKQNVGYYFLMIASILTRRIEESLKHVQIFNQIVRARGGGGGGAHSTNIIGSAANRTATAATGGGVTSANDENLYPISVDKIISYEKHIDQISASIQLYAKSRIRFWERFMKASSLSTNELYRETIKVASLGSNTDQLISGIFRRDDSSWKQSAKMVKILSLYKSTVCNEMHASSVLEQKFQELIKVDQYKDPQYVSNLNFMKGNFAYVTMSLSKEKGRIVSDVNERFLAFFGYSSAKEEVNRVKHVNQLMPPFIANVHSNLVDNYLSRGYSYHINNSFFSFALSKQGFLLPINIYLNNTQLSSDDYTLNALFIGANTQTEYLVAQVNGQIAGLSALAFEKIFNNRSMQEDHQKLERGSGPGQPVISPRNSKFTKCINQIQQNVKFLHGVKDVVSKLNMYFIMPDLGHEISRQIIQTARINQQYMEAEQQNSQQKSKLESQKGTNATTVESIRMNIAIKVPRDVMNLQNKFFANINNYQKLMRTTLFGNSYNMSDTQRLFTSNFTKPISYNNQSNKKPSFNKQTTNVNDYQESNLTSEGGEANIYATSLEIGHSILLKHESAMAISFSNFYNENRKEWESSELVTSLEAQITVHVNRMTYMSGKLRQEKGHYVIEIKDIRPASPESLVESGQAVLPAIAATSGGRNGIKSASRVQFGAAKQDQPKQPIFLPENEYSLRNIMITPKSMSEQGNPDSLWNQSNKIGEGKIPNEEFQQHLEFEHQHLSQPNNYSYLMSLPGAEEISSRTIAHRIDNSPTVTYRLDSMPLKQTHEMFSMMNSTSIPRQGEYSVPISSGAVFPYPDELVGDEINRCATAVRSRIYSGENNSGISQNTKLFNEQIVQKQTQNHLEQQMQTQIYSVVSPLSNSHSELFFSSPRKELVKPLSQIGAAAAVTSKVERYLDPTIDVRSSDQSDIFTSTQLDQIEPQQNALNEAGTSKQKAKAFKKQPTMNRNSTTHTKKQILLHPQQKQFHHEKGSSVSSIKSFKSPSEEIIPLIIRKTNPMSLVRLKIATSNLEFFLHIGLMGVYRPSIQNKTGAIILGFIALSILTIVVDLPILKKIMNMMDDFEPVQELNTSYLQAELYSTIFAGMKTAMYSAEIISLYKQEIVDASFKQMLNYNLNSEKIIMSQASFKELDNQGPSHFVYVFSNQYYSDWFTLDFSITIFYLSQLFIQLFLILHLNREIETLMVNFQMHQSINNDKIMLAAKYAGMDEVKLESLLFLQRNLALNIEECKELSGEVINLFSTQLNALNQGNIIILYLTIAIFTLIIGWSAYVITRINLYTLKILHLITRLNYAEAATEIDKFTRIAELCSVSSTDNWIRIDFKKIMLVDGYKRTKQRDTLIKSKKDQNVSSLINDAKLPFAGSIAVIVSLSIISLFFLAMFVTIQKTLIERITPQINLYESISKAHIDFSTLVSTAETLASVSFLQQNLGIKGSPIAEITGELSSLFAISVEDVRAFNTNYTSIFTNYNADKSELESIFQGDLCKVFTAAASCGVLSTNAESFSKGLIGFLAKTLSFVQVYSKLIYDEVETDNYHTVLLEFLSRQTHTDLIVRNSDIPQISFERAAAIVVSNMQNSIQKIELFTYVYVFGGLVCLTAFLLLSSNLFVFKQEQLIKLINFSLYLIPYLKLSEDNTRHLLKQILQQ